MSLSRSADVLLTRDKTSHDRWAICVPFFSARSLVISALKIMKTWQSCSDNKKTIFHMMLLFVYSLSDVMAFDSFSLKLSLAKEMA